MSFGCLFAVKPADMADDIDEPEDERAIELSTISAIYPELVISPSDPFSAVIDILVEPIKPLAVQFPPLENEVYPSGPLTPPASDEITNSQPGTHSTQEILFIEDNRGQDVHLIAHLPSLTLKIHLPDGYPTQKPPTFYVQAVIPWLPEAKLKEIGDAGLSIWEDMGRDQVVFSYIDHLREEADQGFHLIQDSRAYLTVPQHLKIALLDFDLQAKRTKFEQETFDCGVCLGRVFPLEN